MAEDSHDDDVSTEARRDVLKKGGAVGIGTFAAPGIASATGPDSDGITHEDAGIDPNPENWDPDEWEIDVLNEALQTHEYVGKDRLPQSFEGATRRRDVSPDAPRYEIICDPVFGYCLEVEVIISWYYVGIEVYIAGINVAGGGIGREDKFWEVSFKYNGIRFTVGINAEWDGGYDIDLLVNGEACVLWACVGATVPITP